jgi:hypothetical protein
MGRPHYVPQSALSKLSGQRPPPAPGTTSRAIARALRARHFHFARDPRLLGAEIGFFSILHTWNQLESGKRAEGCLVSEALPGEGSETPACRNPARGRGLATVVYLLPRSVEITRKDQRVEFVAQIDPLFMQQFFNIQEMRVMGELEN